MVGTASAFLRFNIDGVNMHLLAIEDHLRRTSPAYESEEAGCLMKHALQLQEQSLEGISHASEVGDREKVKVFRDLQKGAEALRKRFREKADPDQLIMEVRALRKRAESLDPSFNLEKCASCGDLDEHGVETLKALQADYDGNHKFKVLEEGMAHTVLDSLAEKDGVQPPQLIIDDNCHDPNKGLYQAGKIMVCRSGVSEHVLSHEFGHYKQHLAGKPLDENEAEQYAIEVTAAHAPHSSKGLNSETANYGVREAHMAKRFPELKQVGKIYGASIVGALATPLANQLDTMYPLSVMGQNPSLASDLIGIAAFGIAAASGKWPKWEIPLAVIGGGFVNDGMQRYVFPRIPGMPVSISRGAIRVSYPAGNSRIATMTRPSVRVTPTNGPLAHSIGSQGKFAVVTA